MTSIERSDIQAPAVPGIVGLVTAMPRERAERELRRMIDALRHEPFYSTGTWCDESLGVYAGWCLRSRAMAEAMPLRNEHGDVVLLFSGEEFSEPGTAQRLEQRGHDLDPEGWAYLVHLSEEDPSFPAGLNGRFHGLVVDHRRRTATLFNDRYGMHRVYYHASKDGFYFAAEAKGILAVRPELRSVDTGSLGELVSCGCVLEDRTLFAGIHVLPPAARWVLRDAAAVDRGVYFRPQEWETQTRLEPDAFYLELRHVFARNLPRYFTGRERTAMSLTGGLDTRMIMAGWKPAPDSLPCYTFGGALRESHDVRVAARVAQVCGQRHQVIGVGQELLARFPAYAERTVYLTDGAAEVSRAPDLYLNEVARQIAPVRMTGNYGGEVLRGVRAFKPVEPVRGLFTPELLTYVRRAKETYAGLLRGHPVSFAVFHQAPWYHTGLLALEETQLAVRSPYLDNDLVRTVFRAPASPGTDACLRLIDDLDPALRRIPTDLGLGAEGTFSGLSRALLRLQFRAEYAYDYGMPQWVVPIDRLLSPVRPERLFLGRHKFSHFRLWYRDVLSAYVREVLLDPTTLARPYLVRKTVESVVDDHLNGRRNYTREIHTLLTIELVQRLFGTASAAPDRAARRAG